MTIGSLTVTGLMRQSARYNARRTAIICGERRLSFDEAWKRGIQLANLLLELGLRPGDRVGVLEDNALESQDFFRLRDCWACSGAALCP